MRGRSKSRVLKGAARQQLLDELYSKYTEPGIGQKVLFFRKKYSWIFFVRGASFVKRALDITLSFSFLTLLAPVLLLVALLIRLYDGGPIFYVGKRVGRWGELFLFPKFRSMVVEAETLKEELTDTNDHESGLTFKMKKDPRVTPIGRLIRRLSIDELPQLWCVLVGHMSLVGPRPPVPEEVAEYTLEDRRRLDVRPGITCFWQGDGRSEIAFDGQVALDLQYIESQSLLTDLKILLKTVPAVLLGKGAY